MTGSIVLATDQGLGYLANSFYDHGLIDKVFIQPHSSRESHPEWYREGDIVRNPEDLLQCDSLLFFEEVFHWSIIPKAREKGVKTVLMPMYECTRNPLPYQPDQIIVPSLLDLEYYPGAEFIPVPVEVPWKLRTKAEVFVHNAGNGGIGGRNGTKELLEAIKLVQSPIKLIVRSQRQIEAVDDPRIEYRVGTFDNIWDEGDVFVFPERFNGLSLPLQEAFASGMAVIAGDRHPINTWLPKEPLIPVGNYFEEVIARPFQSARYTHQAIANAIDSLYNQDITRFSLAGKQFAEKNSWKQLKGAYEAVLSR